MAPKYDMLTSSLFTVLFCASSANDLTLAPSYMNSFFLNYYERYDMLTLLQKVEVFEFALSNTTGQDLWKVLWLHSTNSEVWLERRTTYTRSLAVMSMVGYVLGLGGEF